MKKARIISSLVLALVLVFAIASMASAAQVRDKTSYGSFKDNYKETPVSFVYDRDMNYDASMEYPNGIYLPNAGDPAAYRIHSNYTKNTDACAACHATHTAVGGSLLQWGTVYDTCLACHDGTVTTTYNVEGGEIGATNSPTFGGLFSTAAEDGSKSMHNVAGGVKIYAAPGGAEKGDYAMAEGAKADSDKVVSWDLSFGCESCHSPHGQGGNARILKADPNGVARQNAKNGVTLATDTVSGVVYAKAVENAATNKYYTFLKGYPYNKQTNVYDGATKLATSQYTLDNSTGSTIVKFDQGYEPTGTVKADFIPALKVEMDIDNYLAANENVTHISGMNAFCGACHTDYNTENEWKPSKELTGTYTKAYRHKVGISFDNAGAYGDGYANLAKSNMKLEGNDVLTCETCHVAHGASQSYWTKTLNGADGKITLTSGEAVELSGSSALKRLPNMGTCEACHQKGDGADGYNASAEASAHAIEDLASATYVGSDSCQSCHASQYSGWSQSQHTKMVGIGMTESKVDAAKWAQSSELSTLDMNNVLFTLGSKWKQRYIFDADYLNAMNYDGRNNNTPGLIVASGDFVQFSVIDPTTGTNSDGWQGYNNGSVKSWSDACIKCHTTGWTKDLHGKGVAKDGFGNVLKNADGIALADMGDGTTKPYFTEGGTGCEACHGPGSRHAKTQNINDIKNPAAMKTARATEVCGQCHNRGNSTDPEIGVKREDVPEYTPGMDLFAETTFKSNAISATFEYATFTNDGRIQKKISNKPDTSHFYKDNVELGHHQQFEGFIQSKHYLSGAMSCSSCHEVHQASNADEVVGAKGHGLLKGATASAATQVDAVNNTCGACHGAAGATLTYGSNLDNKYMPKTAKNSIQGDIRSHNIFVPNRPGGVVTFDPGTGKYIEADTVNVDTSVVEGRIQNAVDAFGLTD